MWPFGKGSKRALGVDVGTSGIRVVELAEHGEQEKLENYAKVSFPLERVRSSSSAQGHSLSTRRIADLLRGLLDNARVETGRVNFSLPDFSTLFTTFTIPSMKPDEVPQAVRFEARQRIPLPVSEVTLDWVVIGGDYAPRSNEILEILLVVVPNRVIDHYVQIADLAGLKMMGVEAEVFSLQRAFLREQKGTFGLVDIGLQSTTVSIVDDDLLKTSHSFDIGAGRVTSGLVKSAGLSQKEADVFKKNKGLMDDSNEVISPVLDQMISEIDKVVDRFYERKGKDVSRYFLAGGMAGMPGLKDYFEKRIKREVEIGFPFEGMVYPPVLEEELKKIAPEFAIATGIALKGIEE